MNEEITYARNDLVEENTFLKMEAEKTPLPTFEDNKDKLPVPVWDNHDDYLNCYWRVWELAFGNLGTPKEGTGFVSNFIDTAFNGCIFMWDSSFILMFGKYADRLFKFQNTLDNFYSHQHKDGFISRQIDESTGGEYFTRLDPTSTGPNILVWCEWEYFLNFGNKERLARVFPPLMAFHRWMKAHLTWPDGTYYSTGWGCGMDNIPRLQEGYDERFSHGYMVWIDTCAQQMMNCDLLIKMNEVLGCDDVSDLVEEREYLYKLINGKLWDEKTAFYYDLWKNDELNMVKHVGSFWTLLAKAVPKERLERYVAHLMEPKEFNRLNAVPTLSTFGYNQSLLTFFVVFRSLMYKQVPALLQVLDVIPQ